MKLALFLAALSGCATTSTYDKMKQEIEAQRAKITETQQKASMEEHRRKTIEAERDAMIERARRAAPVAPEAATSAPRTDADVPPAAAPVAPTPAVAAPVVLTPFPDQRTAYMGRAPNGWGASPLSVLVKNDVERRIPGEVIWEKYCHTGIEVDYDPNTVVQPNSAMGAIPVMHHVKEGVTVRTTTVIPPGGSAKILMNELGRHHFRLRCYIGPPRMTSITTPEGQAKVVPVLQLFSEWEFDSTNPSAIVATQWHFKEVPYAYY